MIKHITNGRVLNPAKNEDAVRDIFIDKGKIVDQLPAGSKVSDKSTIDAQGNWVIHGIVDLAARFREPGQEYKGTIASESKAALAGGITSVCLQPDTMPVIDTPAVADLIHQRALQTPTPAIYPLGAMSLDLQGKHLSEFAALKAAGCVGVSQAGRYIEDSQLMRNIMDYAASHDLKVFLTPEDSQLAGNGCAHEGQAATRLGLPGIPAAAETIAVARDLMLVEATGVAAHFCRLSCARSVELIRQAKAEGMQVSADVAAHQLFLTDIDISDYDSNLHVRPPLRSIRDKDALRQAVKNGVIDAICSDHQPQDADAKLAPFGETSPGISALDTLAALVLKLIHEDSLPPLAAAQLLSSTPANILGIPAGTLNSGAAADITIIDPQANWTFSAADSHSSGKNTPFDGWSFSARVTHTLIGGKLLYQLS